MWVAGLNRVGVEAATAAGRPTSTVARCYIAPTGEVVAQLGDEKDAILHCEIDTEIGATQRNEWGFFRDRRPDAYASLVAP